MCALCIAVVDLRNEWEIKFSDIVGLENLFLYSKKCTRMLAPGKSTKLG